MEEIGVPARETRLLPIAVGVVAVESMLPEAYRHVRIRRMRVAGARGWFAGRPNVLDTRRLAVAMAAYRWGYFLVDIIDIGVTGTMAGLGWAWVRRLVNVTEADALVIHGPVDRMIVDSLAAELRLLVRVAGEGGVAPSVGRLGAWGAAPQSPKTD